MHDKNTNLRNAKRATEALLTVERKFIASGIEQTAVKNHACPLRCFFLTAVKHTGYL
jgi:hypothetical protein